MSTWSGDSSSFSPSEFPNFAARERDSDDSVTSNSSSNSSSNGGRNDRSNEVRAGYSVANSSENPSDRQSLADIEEVVNQSRRKREREEVARRVEQNVENELDREIKSDSQSPQTGHGPLRLHKRRPNKKQRTCSGLIIFGFFLAVFAVIGVGAVVYYVVLDNSFLSSEYSEKVEAPSPGNGFATPTWPPASTPVPTQDPTGPPTFPTRSPIAQYLAQEHGVVFPDDPIAPGYQAITWLVDEANTPGAKIIYDLRLVQRFAMVAVNLALKTDESGLSFGEIGVDECDWEGVFCVNGTVTELSFGQKLLTGIIPPEIGLLQSLVSLDLSDNALFGRIPETLYDLINLERLFLYKNKLVGTISDRIGNLKHLSHLHLSHNTFTGSLPKSMFDQKNSPFYYINVYSNSFSGSLPSMSGWQNIWYLDLGRNDFSGPLPWDMHKMTALQHLHLDHNSFSGTIEIDFEKVGGGELQALSLDNNQFTGYFPYERGTLFSLASATLTNNSFSEIDWHICELSSLEEFADGALVEYTADCNICWCQPWCGHC